MGECSSLTAVVKKLTHHKLLHSPDVPLPHRGRYGNKPRLGVRKVVNVFNDGGARRSCRGHGRSVRRWGGRRLRRRDLTDAIPPSGGRGNRSRRRSHVLLSVAKIPFIVVFPFLILRAGIVERAGLPNLQSVSMRIGKKVGTDGCLSFPCPDYWLIYLFPFLVTLYLFEVNG